MTLLADRNRRLGLVTLGVALAMLGLAFASVPLYRLFCQVTGFAGTTRRVAEVDLPAQALAREMTVRFDANVRDGLSWRFEPVNKSEVVRIGEKRLAFFRAVNTSDRPVTGRATFNVSPDTAGYYFSKVQCFCFTEQTLAPGETVMMPVVYFIDPAIVKDDDGRRVEEVTLSYTFYPLAPKTASLPVPADSGGRKPTKTLG